MSIDILMPALSPTMEDGVLAKWHVAVGDTVKAGDVIAEIETDKATMEVEAADEGVILALLVAAGTEGVKVNTVIAQLASEGETETVAGSAPPPIPDSRALPPKGEDLKPANPPPLGQGDREAVEGAGPSLDLIAASPLARRLARAAGLDLATIIGSGPHGRIIKRDIDAQAGRRPVAALASSGLASPVLASALRPAQSLEEMGIAPGSYDLVAQGGMGKTIARRMTESFRDIPHFPLSIDLELDALLEARTRINAGLEASGVKVSVNDLIIRCAALALKRVPMANASYTPQGIAVHHHADIAVAVAIDGGLITPIIRAAETKGLAQIATEMKDLAARARARKLRPEEFQGGTFSISNLGMFGIKSFASIINEPQGAILSVGAGEKRAVVRGDSLAIATVMSVTLTCDHRVLNGTIGAQWLNDFKALVEDPLMMLA
jgi:pyruvate dehydrogenase E2 component (dihydrolipoamide acetyltransferase)